VTANASGGAQGGDRIRLVMELRRAGIDDTAVLSAIERLPRAAFVANEDQARAWDDVALPGSTRPLHAATYLRALALAGRERVLQVPTGSGYLAALLAGACRMLYTVDERRQRQAAEARIRALKVRNVVGRDGDPLAGWADQAPFDRILFDGVVATIPTALLLQLRDGGSMVLALGVAPEDARFPRDTRFADITRVVRTGDSFESESLLRTSFAPSARY
jgi:protein-L-isoaspartate(D-aspartate) O-methyltransferase